MYLTTQTALDYYPYGKELRAYNSGGEKYKSTYNERDQETNYDFRNARSSTADVVRFNTLDPLAAQFVSWSPYSYVMGNPVRLVDPMGARTFFFDDKGNHLYTSNEKGDDVVTIIDDIFSSTFIKWYWDGENVEATRLLGTSYDVKSIIDFTNRASKERDQSGDFYEKDSKGNFIPAKIEVGNYLYLDAMNNIAHIGGADRDLIGTPTATIYDNSEGSLTTIHYHPDNARFVKFYTKNDDLMTGTDVPGDKGPSDGDEDRQKIRGGFYHIVTGENGRDGNSMYFYGSQKTVIEIPFSTFKK